MSDSEDEQEDGGSVSLTGFLFGNIDLKTGQLEDSDILDSESKRQLNALQKFGLGSIMNDVMEGQEQKESVATKKRKNRRLVSSYDSSSDSEEEEDDEDILPPVKISHSSQPVKSTVDEDDNYDEQKSPSAVDFSDITELAVEEESSAIATLTSATADSSDDTDYDDPDGQSKHVRRLFATEKDDKFLMPPPLSTHIKKAAGGEGGKETEGSSPTKFDPSGAASSLDPDKKLETPLAAMMPSKYAGVDVSEIFPEFRRGKVLRFSRLFVPGKPSSLPQVWKSVKRRRRKRKILAEGQAAADAAEEADREKRGWEFDFAEQAGEGEVVSDDEESLLNDNPEKPRDNSHKLANGEGRSIVSSNPNIWRHGPAELWFDMMNAPEDCENFDYGFQVHKRPRKKDDDDETSSEDEEPIEDKENVLNGAAEFPGEAFHMLTQRDWESDIVWDGSDAKYKKLTKNTTGAGWVPSAINRTAQNFSSPNAKGSPGGSSQSSSSAPGTPTTPLLTKKDGTPLSGSTSSPSISSHSGSSKTSKSSGSVLKSEEGGQVDDTWYSIFPVETPELVYGKWEDEVIWGVDDLVQPLEPKILSLDPNDENIVLCIPDDVDPNAAQGTAAPVKVKIPHPHVKKSKILLGKAGVINVIEEDSPPPSPKNDDKDPYNISNDEYYLPKYSEQSLLKISASGNIIQHSTPVVELRAPFIPTFINQIKLRGFHRPALKKYGQSQQPPLPPLAHPGPHPVFSLTRHIRKKAKQREQERLAAGGGDIFFMRAPDDLTGKDGELILIEYCEEHPPLLSQVGMCSRIRNYYKRQAGKDKGPPEMIYGEVVYAHTTPFLGVMQSGSCVQTLENLLYRAPIYQHPTIFSDFLVIRTRTNYFIREIDALFTAGQECPLFEVPGPNSKRANNFVRDFLQVFIYRLFWKSRDSPRRIRMEEIKRAFPMHSESSIRKRLKLCADFKRTGADSNWWVIKPEFRLPTEEEIRSMVSPEQCCAYFSLVAAEQRLKDAGYGEKFLFAPQEDDDDDNQNKIDDEVKTAPWNTTRAYIQAMKNKCLLQLTGPADPTGCGEGFSYIRVPNKPQTNKEEQEAQPKRIVTGTDADLRRLSLNNAKALLRKFDVPEEEIKKLSRWEVIDVVRTLSTEKAKAGEKGMTKFSRGNRFSVAEHQERYKEECQRIYELQNRVLSSSEVLSTDDDESSDSELSDIEEMGKNIENIISNKKTNTQVNLEKEEQERRELQKMILGDSKDDDDKSPRKRRKEEEENQTLSGLVNHPGRVLKIYRTFRTPDGKEFTRPEIVRKPAIIDIYMRIRTTKDESFIRQFALLDEQAKEEMKKEKRRIQEQLRRIKRNQEKDTSKPSPAPRKKKVKLKPDLKMKCGACGQVGHMRTNKACPLYNSSATSPPLSSMNASNASNQDDVEDDEDPIAPARPSVPHAQQARAHPEDDELVRVEGTKVQLSGKVMQMSEEITKRSLVLKVAKGDSPFGRKKRKASASPHCDYLAKKRQNTNRRRIDPLVVITGIFEQILNELRDMPDSNHFHTPVNAKVFTDYPDRVLDPMDLRTIRENLREKKYALTSEFLTDVSKIYDNSVLYNGPNALITEFAQNLLSLCKQRLKEKSDQLSKLERLINPLLDDDQKGLAYILDQCLARLKSAPEAYPFLKPVDPKKVKDYYQIVTQPIDLAAIEDKNKENQYDSRQDFYADLEQIWINSRQYNGMESIFTAKAASLMTIARVFLLQFEDQLEKLEGNIANSKSKIFEEFGDASNMYYEDQSRDAEGFESEEEDEEMEVVEPPQTEEDDEQRSAAAVSGILEDIDIFGEHNMHSTTQTPLSQQISAALQEDYYSQSEQSEDHGMEESADREEGEYVSDEEGRDFQEVQTGPLQPGVDESMRDNAALLGMALGNVPHTFQHPGMGRFSLPSGAETPRNIHDDLQVSDSDDDDEPNANGQYQQQQQHQQQQQQQQQQQSESESHDDDGYGIYF